MATHLQKAAVELAISADEHTSTAVFMLLGWTPPASQSHWMPQSKEGSTAMDLLAIDLGKRSFHIYGVDGDGVIISRKVG